MSGPHDAMDEAVRARLAEAERAVLARAPESEVDPSTEQIAAVMDLLGDPQRAFRVIHVTGTNGKTSTARIADGLLRELGLHTGRFTSPHLHSMRERIVLGGEPISVESFLAAYDEVMPVVELVESRAGSTGARMNFFQVLVALGYAAFADALAPGLFVAQAMGRFGNYFNQELFGVPTTLPWALQIDPAHRPAGYEQFATFHPTFLYEALWTLTSALLLLWLDKRFRLQHGQMLAAYVVAYASGRAWIENIRIDPITYDNVGGLRMIVWVSMIAMVIAAAALIRSRRTHGGNEDPIYRGEVSVPGDAEPAEAEARTGD